MEEVFELVRENITQAGYEYKLPAGVVLTGGSAELPGLTGIAKKVFGVPARVGQPRGLEGLVDGISSPGYASVQGLILYGMNDEGFNVARGSANTNQPSGAGIGSRLGGFFKNLLP
jgi:cell division protein FtsA